MYNFGDNKQTAKLMMLSAAAQTGPGVSNEEDLDNCTKLEVQSRLIYASAALRKAVREEQDEELIYQCSLLYEKHLVAFCWHSDAIFLAMEANKHKFPWGDYGAMMRQKLLVERTVEARRERDRNAKSVKQLDQ